MIIKKIFKGNFDDEVHSSFLKFGRGVFPDRFLLDGKKQKDKWSIKADAEYANYLVRKCLEEVSGSVDVKGVIVTTLNLGNDDELGFEVKKRGNFQGIKKLEIDTSIDKQKILDLMDKYPRVFFGLSFKTPESELKIKAKPPKSGKPKTKGDEKPKADFCSIKTSNKQIIEDLFFDYSDFKNISVNHVINVEEIVYPENMDSMRPEEVRENSKRKGKIIRNIEVDGQQEVNESDFVA